MERFEPKDTVKREYIEVPIDTTAIGNLSQLETFFERLANNSRVMNVTEVTLTPVPPGQWRSKFVVTAFALP